MQRIGIFGGTFNPVHFGHLAAAEEVRERTALDLVLFVPSFLPPHKSEVGLPSALQRQEMVRLAIAGNRFFALSDIEVRRGGRSYTIDTIESLRSSYPDADLFFITGLDSFLDITTWHQWELLLTRCTFVVLSRPGYHFSDLQKIDFMKQFVRELDQLDGGAKTGVQLRTKEITIHLEAVLTCDISSREIRKRVVTGRAIKYLLPDLVEQYIITNKLYA